MNYILSKKVYILVIFILFSGAVLRIYHIRGDAPVADISRSGVFYVDEGTYSHNAVNKILYGTWFLKYDYNPISNVPLYSFSQYLCLNVFGVSLASVRMTSVIYIILALFLLWFLIKITDPLVALVALILGASNYFFIIYNRLALIENQLILFLIIESLILYQYTRRKTIGWLIVLVVMFWIGYFIKPTVLFFMPMVFLSIFYTAYSQKKILLHLYIYFLISSVLLLLVYFLWVVPHFEDWHYFEGRNIHQYINESFLIFLMNYARYFTNLKLFQFMPLTYSLFLLYLTYLIYELINKKRLMFIDWFFACWAVVAFLFLGFFKYSPPRHSIILIPAILVLCSSFIIRTYRGELNFKDKNIYILTIPTLFLIICQIFFGIYRIHVYDQYFLSCYLPFLGIAVLIVYVFLYKQWLHHKRAALILLVSILLLNGYQVTNYHATMQYSYDHAIKDIARLIDEEPSQKEEHILLGDIAPLVSIELQTRALSIIFKGDTELERIISHCPNYLVLQDNDELKRLSKMLPTYFDRVELLSRYQIFNNYLNDDDTYFYRIDNDYIARRLWVKNE
ncbi:glycosyltransferase family 39 protein [candidate division KSB1 bacterium]|nr:glycosyltransferase family 39 protein [candidate division KSB1 bacterium]